MQLVCPCMVTVDSRKFFPLTKTKHLYAEAIIKSFSCLGTKVISEGKVTFTHEVFYDQVAGGYIENKLKDMRGTAGTKIKLNASSNSIETERGEQSRVEKNQSKTDERCCVRVMQDCARRRNSAANCNFI